MLCACFLINIGKYKMKYVKTVKIRYGKAEGNYQIGQLGKDEGGNQYRYAGYSVRRTQGGFIRTNQWVDFRGVHKAKTLHDAKLEQFEIQTFLKLRKRGTGKKDIQSIYYNNFQQSNGYGRIRG